MKYKNSGKDIVVRLDERDEIIDTLSSICKVESVDGALVMGIGAAKYVEIGHWNPKEKKYETQKFEGLLEIVSLSGNITMMNGEPVIHIHIAIGTEDFSTKSGHLIKAEVYPTCEIVLLPIDASTREKDEKTGLNLLKI
jgi:predicted DNA-binding protein with PD1-like motif